ncbi:MAG: nucleoside deaminase [Bosea sp.]|uniref:nucleoside deaminase n=1 Tax=Bosea sp. (in: a-proteobacteria) TaxID=1871050 RepID=UPI0023A62191|nr:nucleoside deaminase [Bosea sp. (in: a-proteobacteria)]MCP4736198.1 nucleoside deaminase [Bosea sp. (in: a-proteobacteria)]
MKTCRCEAAHEAGCEAPEAPARRRFLATAVAAGAAGMVSLSAGSAKAAPPPPGEKKFMEEATRLAIESVEKGWGGPFGAVIVKDGEIIGRGQNRVLLTGIPVFHAEVTAIMDASARLNPKALLGSDYGAGTILEMIPREAGSPDPVPERARMLKGCSIYINGAPCPMCMSAIYWSRIDHVYFAASLKDTSAIGFDDAFQYEDFAKPWADRRIKVAENFERETGLKAYEAWMNKKDRHPY